MDVLNQKNNIFQGKPCVNANRTNKSPEKQKGMTAIGMVIVIALVGFFALIAIRLFPIYMEYFSVRSHVRDVAYDPEISKGTDAQILDTLRKRFDIDDVKDVTADDIIIDRASSPSTITVQYEVRTPAIGNVDMVVNFSYKVNIH